MNKLMETHLNTCINELYASKPNIDRFADAFEQMCYLAGKDIPGRVMNIQAKPQDRYFDFAAETLRLTEQARTANL